MAPARRVLRADSTGSLPPCEWHRPAAHPTYRLCSEGEKTTCMSYLFATSARWACRSDGIWALRQARALDRLRARQAQGEVSTLQGLLEAQDANDRGRHRFGARGQGEAHSRAAVSLIEVRAWGECDTMLLEQCLAPRFGVGVWT